MAYYPESPGAWLCYPQSPALLKSNSMTYCPVGLETGSSLELKLDCSLNPLPIILLWARALLYYPQSPAVLQSGFVTHNSLLVWSLDSLPIISSKLEICHLWFPCRPRNHITHNAWRPRSDHRGGVQVSRAPFTCGETSH